MRRLRDRVSYNDMRSNEFIRQMNLLILEYAKSNGVVITGISPNPDIIDVGFNRRLVSKY